MKTKTNKRSFQGEIAALLAVSLFAVCGLAYAQNNSSRPPPQAASPYSGGGVEGAADSNTPDNTYVTDGTVNAIVLSGNTIYIGGLFNRVGPRTGPGVELALDGSQNPGLPEISGTEARILTQVSDGAGGRYIGGTFTRVGGIARNNIAHIRADHSVDPAFAPDADATINTLAVSDDGLTIYAGGTFTSIGGQPRNKIAGLNAANGAATAFNPNPNGVSAVGALAVSGPIVYAGGQFTTIGGQARNRIAALNASDGTATLTFDPNSPGSVTSLAVAGSILYIGGNFTTIAGQPRNRMAALTIGGPLDGTATSFNPNANNAVNAIAVSNSTVYVIGSFTTIGGQSRRNLAALDATSGLVTPFNPAADANSSSMAVTADGLTLYVGGGFRNIGGQPRRFVAAINTADGTATSFNPDPNGTVEAIGVSASAVYLGGTFSSIGGVVRKSLAAIDATTGIATSFNPDSSSGAGNATVNALAVADDASTVYVGGAFTSFGGQPRTHLAALNAADGTATSWNPSAGNIVKALALSDPLLYVGGNFVSIGGQPRNFLAALGVSDGLATAWNPNPFNGQVSALAVSGPIVYAGGIFTMIGNQNRVALAALNTSDGSATAWNPNIQQPGFNPIVHVIAVSGSTIYAGGYFTLVQGISRKNIVAINAGDGTVTSFNPQASGVAASDSVDAIAASGSKVYAAGRFLTIGGQSRTSLAELNPSDGSATAFNPLAAGGGVAASALAVAPNGTLYVGGAFKGFDLAAQRCFGAFSNPSLVLTSVVSRKTQGAAGTFDLPLPITDSAGIECRNGGANGDHLIVFTFANSLSSIGAASVTTGSATISNATFTGSQVFVNLTDVANAQTIAVTLGDVNDGINIGNVVVSMGLLLGDSNADRFVNAGDALQTRNRSGQSADATNFRSDVNSDGFVNSGDTTLVRANSGSFLP